MGRYVAQFGCTTGSRYFSRIKRSMTRPYSIKTPTSTSCGKSSENLRRATLYTKKSSSMRPLPKKFSNSSKPLTKNATASPRKPEVRPSHSFPTGLAVTTVKLYTDYTIRSKISWREHKTVARHCLFPN